MRFLDLRSLLLLAWPCLRGRGVGAAGLLRRRTADPTPRSNGSRLGRMGRQPAPAALFRPEGDGPFRLALIKHLECPAPRANDAAGIPGPGRCPGPRAALLCCAGALKGMQRPAAPYQEDPQVRRGRLCPLRGRAPGRNRSRWHRGSCAPGASPGRRAPVGWLVAANESDFPSEPSRKLADALRAGGGRAEFLGAASHQQQAVLHG